MKQTKLCGKSVTCQPEINGLDFKFIFIKNWRVFSKPRCLSKSRLLLNASISTNAFWWFIRNYEMLVANTVLNKNYFNAWCKQHYNQFTSAYGLPHLDKRWLKRTSKSNSTKSNPSIDLINKTVITCQSFVGRIIELNQFTRKAKIAFGNKTRGFQNFKTT